MAWYLQGARWYHPLSKPTVPDISDAIWCHLIGMNLNTIFKILNPSVVLCYCYLLSESEWTRSLWLHGQWSICCTKIWIWSLQYSQTGLRCSFVWSYWWKPGKQETTRLICKMIYRFLYKLAMPRVETRGGCDEFSIPNDVNIDCLNIIVLRKRP